MRGAIERAQNDASIAPETVAELQYHLGNVLAANPHGNRALAYEEAIGAYETALHVYTLSRYPRPYAKCKVSLGPVYYERKQGERRTNLEQAIACYKAALQIYTREAFPIQWTSTQYNLGVAYQDRIAGDLQDNMEEAISCYKAALQIYIRETFPIQWAMVQYNLGAAYSERSAGDLQDNMEEAISCYKAALQVYTRDAYPKEWAPIRTNLGTAYYKRIAGERRDNIEQAIQCYKAVLQALTCDTFPAEWAKVQNELGKAYNGRIAGERRDNLEQAIAYHEAALQILTRETFPRDWAWAHMGLGNAYLNRIQEEKRTNLERTISHHNLTLQIFTRDTFPKDWAMSQVNLGNACQFRIDGERSANLEQAIACYKKSLQIYTRETFPNEWAKIQNNLGSTYYDRIVGERSDNLEQAIKYSLAALQVHTWKGFPNEWAMAQFHLGNAYLDRIAGERRNNLERAITSYEVALQVYKRETFPEAWAKIQNGLAAAYGQRMTGERQENREQAIKCCRAALQVHTREAFPEEWAKTQVNLGLAYEKRIKGERRDNMEQAIRCSQAALQVYTREAFPEEWAKTQNNLGYLYRHRIAGDRRANLEKAIACFEAVLYIFTREAFPSMWAFIQRNLGDVYQNRVAGGRSDNLERAVTYCQSALLTYKCDAFPAEHRLTQLGLMQIEAARQNWPGVHNAYKAACAAEARLVQLGAGIVGRDIILKEGGGAAALDALALTRLGRVDEAIVTIEQGRARGLAEALMLDAADPELIGNIDHRKRYIAARTALNSTQAALAEPLPPTLTESGQRQIMLKLNEAYRVAKENFDRIVAEIREANDPADFLQDILKAGTVSCAAAVGGPGHALVYLASTSAGGIALAALNANPHLQMSARFGYCDLPDLTHKLVADLIEIYLDDDPNKVIGGFAYAQLMYGSSMVPRDARSLTWRQTADALHAAGMMMGKTGMLIEASQATLRDPQLEKLVDQPLENLSSSERLLLRKKLADLFLKMELQRCLKQLAEAAMCPLMAWLHKQGVSSLTLIPCGYLAAFPLMAVLLDNENTIGETLPTSVAPSARSLLREDHTSTRRAGVFALGNPYPTELSLWWGEKEVETLVTLAGLLGLSSEVKTKEQAERDWFVDVMDRGKVVAASCHGRFDMDDFLRSKLLLADGEELTLADLLSDKIDLHGLRLLILSACQTAIVDLQGAVDEVRSLTVGMIQAGARAVLASLWEVNDMATYLLMVRFAQEWLPVMDNEPPAAALARAQRWLRTAKKRDLQQWSVTHFSTPMEEIPVKQREEIQISIPVNVKKAEDLMHKIESTGNDSDICPYADPFFWAGFQITGW